MVLSLIFGIHKRNEILLKAIRSIYMSSAMTMRSYFSTIFASSFIVFSDKQLSGWIGRRVNYKRLCPLIDEALEAACVDLKIFLFVSIQALQALRPPSSLRRIRGKESACIMTSSPSSKIACKNWHCTWRSAPRL